MTKTRASGKGSPSALPRLYLWIGNGSGVGQSRRIATIHIRSKSHALVGGCPNICGERRIGNKFIVRRGGLLMLLHEGVGGSPYSAAGVGKGMV